MNLAKLFVFFCIVFFITSVQAEDIESQKKDVDIKTSVRDEDNDFREEDESEFSLMKTLAQRGLHNIKNERWNAYGQATYIETYKPGFRANYTNFNGTPNSLSATREHTFTATVSAYFGVKAWKGAEFYAEPAMISEIPLSGLHGLGGSIQNFELQKNGSVPATWYRERSFYRQTMGFGGQSVAVPSGPMQLAGIVDSRRFVLTIGTLSVLDIFDRNTFASDLRQQFTNMAFMTHAAYDFAADARGYTFGIFGEYYHDDWAFRFARLAPPKNPNQLAINFDIAKFYGDQIEIEHRHKLNGLPGAVRILGFRNRENMGKFTDAIAAYESDPNKNATTCTGFNYDSPNASAPDLCWARKANIKKGIGINIEQQVSEDIGVFFRGMYSDGKTEVYAYVSSDRSLSIGGIMKGIRWGREKDAIGLGFAESWISSQHAKYLAMGGIDGFIGDGKLNQKAEYVVDIYYKFHPFTSTWLTLDYQHIANPAYNGDRGPVEVVNGKIHFEF